MPLSAAKSHKCWEGGTSPADGCVIFDVITADFTPRPRHLDRTVARWFAGHGGLITRADALALGLTRHQIQDRVVRGAWVRIHPGVYRVAGIPLGPLADLRAAILVGGPHAVASHGSAAWLLGLGDEPRRPPTITVPVDHVARVAGVRMMRTSHPVRPVVRRGLPCTDPVRTILDGAAAWPPAAVDDLVDRAVARRAIGIPQLVRVATGARESRFYRGRSQLARCLERRGIAGSPNPSVLESRMARLLRGHGLAPPRAEVWWGQDRRYRLDFAYPDIRLVIEVDGWSAHFLPEQQRHDHRRANQLSQAGWTVLRYDWWTVSYEPDLVAAEIAATYARLQRAA